MATPGRNDPCPCGSGKKYKHCCATVAQARDPLEVAAELHAMDARLAAQLLSFGQSEYPTDFAKARKRIPFPDPVDAAHRSIFGHFLAYLSEVEAGSLLELFLARRKARLGPVELDWLEATRAAPLSVWEVLEVQPGRSMHLRDLFDGQEREVMERSATQTLQRRHAVCACVVQAGDVAVMAGGHPQPFEPVEAERVVRAMREFDAQQPPSVPASRRPALRNWALLNAWHSTARGLAERPLPTLVNMEGDPLQETEDRYRLAPGARPAVEKALGSLEGFDVLTLPDAESKEATLFNVTRNERPSHGAWEKVSLGSVEVGPDRVLIHTNSEKRADALRARVEAACGARTSRVERTRRDPQDFLASRMGRMSKPAAGQELPPEVAAQAEKFILEAKRKHYSDWCDHPVPALDGLTPAQAMRQPSMRQKVIALLKSIELGEAREAPGRRYDVAPLWRALGVEDP